MDEDKAIPRQQGSFVRAVLLGALLAGGLGIFLLLQAQKPSPVVPMQASSASGGPAPDFTLPNLDNERIRLSDFRGKVVLLNIWATWCPPCVEEMPSMEKLYQTLKDEGFEILAVSVDADGARSVAPFMEKHALSFSALTDPAGVIKDLYRPTGVPESHIIDRDGNLVEKVIGPRDWASPDIVRFFRELLDAG